MGNAGAKLNDPMVKQGLQALGDLAKQNFGPQVKNIEGNFNKIKDVKNFVHR
jgi:hypothetical protein